MSDEKKYGYVENARDIIKHNISTFDSCKRCPASTRSGNCSGNSCGEVMQQAGRVLIAHLESKLSTMTAERDEARQDAINRSINYLDLEDRVMAECHETQCDEILVGKEHDIARLTLKKYEV